MQIIRKRRAKIHLLARNWMVESKPCSVKEVSFWWKSSQAPPASAAIRVIADNRMSNGRQVHSYLVSPSGIQMCPQQVSTGKARKAAKIRACVLPSTDDCHALPVSGIARDWLVHR